MLFDLRSRGRRRTVQVIYAILALIMLGGLIGVGVGTGSGGGILNAISDSNSSNNGGGNTVQSAAVKSALAQTKKDPSSAAAWEALVTAQYDDFENQTKEAPARALVADVTNSYARYLTLTQSPDPQTALLASRAYALQKNFKAATTAKQIWANANPTAASAFECLYMSASAAKETRIASLAQSKAISLVPKAQQFELTQQLKQEVANASTYAASC